MTKTKYFAIYLPGNKDRASYSSVTEKHDARTSEIKPFGKYSELYNAGVVKYISFIYEKEDTLKKFRAELVKNRLSFKKIKGDELYKFDLEGILRNSKSADN